MVTRRRDCPRNLPPPTRVILSSATRVTIAISILFFIAVRWLQQQCVGKVSCFIPVAPLLWWQHSFFIFICIAIGLLHQRWLGVGDFFFVPCLFIFVLLPNDNEEVARLSPQRFQRQRAFFIFYCHPMRTTSRRSRGCSHTPSPPTRNVLSAAARPMTTPLF